MPAIKPQMTLVDGYLYVFMGSDYKKLTLEQGRKFCADFQSLIARAKREEKRQRRIAAKNFPSTEHAA